MNQLTVEQRTELGRSQRKATPRTSHAEWQPGPDRPDPVAILEAQNQQRLEFLVPLRHARMQVSPFTFYRGAAAIMAADLAGTPSSGIGVQLAGDAHLSNFGAYASPERQLVFDQNDFDETLPGPWEWDLKRLATSFVVAGQFQGFTADDTRRGALEACRAYREAMAGFAEMGFTELWYDYVSVDDVRAGTGVPSKDIGKRLDRFSKRATRKTSLQALEKLAENVDGTWRIRSEPPVLYSLRDLPIGQDPQVIYAATMQAFEDYKQTLDDNRRALLDRYTVVDIGLKVVGVGSVGERCFVMLLRGRDENDPLFLQAKEAGLSALEGHLPPSRYQNHGQRVVEGQRLVQAQSDIFLGWTVGNIEGRHFYVRQLRDWKGSAEVESAVTPDQLAFYAGLCGMTLARGHARSGDAEAIRAYAGKSDTLDRSITAFAERYAQQNGEDFERFQGAIASGRLPITELA